MYSVISSFFVCKAFCTFNEFHAMMNAFHDFTMARMTHPFFTKWKYMKDKRPHFHISCGVCGAYDLNGPSIRAESESHIHYDMQWHVCSCVKTLLHWVRHKPENTLYFIICEWFTLGKQSSCNCLLHVDINIICQIFYSQNNLF